MRLKLTVQLDADRREDVVITADATNTVADIAQVLVTADPNGRRSLSAGSLTLRVDQPSTYTLPGSTSLAASGLQSGQHVTPVPDGGSYFDGNARVDAAATLSVVAGPDAGKTFPLKYGSNQVGRGRSSDVRLTDPLVSKAHVRINVSEQIDIADLGSSNGLQLRGGTVVRAVLGASDVVTIGDTSFSVVQHAVTNTGGVPQPTVEFNRSPRLDPHHVGEEFVAPDPPQRPQPGRFPIIPLIAPVVMASVMFAITRNPSSVLFVALSPLMMVGSFVENRYVGKKAFEDASRHFHSALADLEVQLHYTLEQEGIGRRREHPSTDELHRAIEQRDQMLWTRRPDMSGFLDLRLGLGAASTRSSVKLPTANNTTADLWRELVEVPKRYATVADVPVVADLGGCGSVGIAGPAATTLDAARSAVLQAVGLHSPAELVLCALVSPAAAAEWDWLKWLPHASSEHAPFEVEQIAVATTGPLVSALADLVASRTGEHRQAGASTPLPRVVVFVDDAASMDRAEVVSLMERGPAVGVHFIWHATSVALLPAACRVYLAYDAPAGEWVVGDTRDGSSVRPVAPELCSQAQASADARRLAPVVDAGAPVDDDTDVPRNVALLNLVDRDLASSTDTVIQQWRASFSLPSEYPKPGEKRKKSSDEISLRAVVGATSSQPFTLDLRSQGPHALVGGTTGAGKSEFLQSWVLGMAAAHSPDRVNFLFVDYKGGAAFSECTHLPHCVGLVTDLSPHLVRRALISLKAELRYREELLQHHKANDLVALEKKDIAAAPPSLIIMVDEFAALAKEVPDFVEGVVDIAQRGRSLGLHLVLATQRPAGVIRDNIRANTNLRIALRMADEADSMDVVGTKQAALFDQIPGRGLAKLGPGRLTTFQTAYAGGWTTGEAPKPVVVVDELRLGGGARWEVPEDEGAAMEPADRGPNDLKRIVSNVVEATKQAGIPAPRRPWQPDLAEVYELARLRPSRSDRVLVFGILDDPQNQRQLSATFDTEDAGNMAVFGTSGAGKSAAMRSLAVAAGLSTEGACHVYALDFGSRGLSMLEAFPHVGAVIGADDGERVARLIRHLRATIDERARRYAAVNAGTLTEYRSLTGNADEPRILVLLDGFGAFRSAYESGTTQVLYDMLVGSLAAGRPVGVHFVISADRPGIVPSAVASNVQQRLVLRLAQDSDYSYLGLPADTISPSSPAGRGFLDDAEVQVAVLGGQTSTARQSTAVAKLAEEMLSSPRWQPAPPIERLPETVELGTLPVSVDGLPALGVADESLAPLGFGVDEPMLVCGPPQANRSTYVLSIVQSIARQRPGVRMALLSLRPSRLAPAFPWVDVANNADEIVALVQRIASRQLAVDGVLFEGVQEFSGTPADQPSQDLVRAVTAAGGVVIADADSNTMGNSYGIGQTLRASRHGLALQPDQPEGDALFRTTFPRTSRGEHPLGRAFYVRHGKVTKVQLALPLEELNSPAR